MPKRSEVTDPAEYNRLVVEEFRANKGKVSGDFEGRPILILTTTGAKSGQERTTPLIYADYGDRLIVTAAAGGQPNHPGWYHNIAANPAVRVEVGDEAFSTDAIVTSGEDRATIFAERCATSLVFEGYAQKAGREIPIIAFSRPSPT